MAKPKRGFRLAREVYKDEAQLAKLTGQDRQTIYERATVLSRLGSTYRAEGQYQLSVDRYASLESMLAAAGIDYGLGFARLNQATSLMMMGRYQEALEKLDSGLAVGVSLDNNDKTGSALGIRIHLLEKLGRVQEAAVVADALIAHSEFPSEEQERALKSVAFAARAKARNASGDLALALESWEEALAYSTNEDARAEALLGKGHVLQSLGCSSAAADAYRELLSLSGSTDKTVRDAQDQARTALALLDDRPAD